MNEKEFDQEIEDLIILIKSSETNKLSELAKIADLDLKQDLVNVDLSGEDLSYDNLSGADLSGPDLAKLSPRAI